MAEPKVYHLGNSTLELRESDDGVAELLERLRASGMHDLKCSACGRPYLTREMDPLCPPCRDVQSMPHAQTALAWFAGLLTSICIAKEEPTRAALAEVVCGMCRTAGVDIDPKLFAMQEAHRVR